MRSQVLLMVLAAALIPGCGKRHDPSFLNIKYRVTPQGGLQPSTPLTIISKTNQIGCCTPPDEDRPAKETLHGPV